MYSMVVGSVDEKLDRQTYTIGTYNFKCVPLFPQILNGLFSPPKNGRSTKQTFFVSLFSSVFTSPFHPVPHLTSLHPPVPPLSGRLRKERHKGRAKAVAHQQKGQLMQRCRDEQTDTEE